jgi:hypothetical protein
MTLMVFAFGSIVVSDVNAQLRQQSDTASYRSLIPLETQELMKNIDFIFNMQMGFRSDFKDGTHLGSKFQVEQFRLEIKGYVHRKIFFRFRHRYTSEFQPQTVDKIIKGVDIASLRFDLSDKWEFTIGKTYPEWGGIEYDLNPIDIYEYSDIMENADVFLSGVGVYNQTTKNHGFSIQILNSRTGSFEELYDTVPNIESSKIPLASIVSWRGKFLGGKLTTLWSYSLFTEAKGIFKNYLAFGNQLRLKKLTLAYDFKWSKEDLDRTGIISRDVPDDIYNYALENTMYTSHWIKVDYRFAPKWQVSLVTFYDNAKWLDDNLDPTKTTDDWRTAYGIIPTLEYFPFDNLNLKFYLGLVSRIYNYSDYAKSRVGATDYTTLRVIAGVITPLHIL